MGNKGKRWPLPQGGCETATSSETDTDQSSGLQMGWEQTVGPGGQAGWGPGLGTGLGAPAQVRTLSTAGQLVTTGHRTPKGVVCRGCL